MLLKKNSPINKEKILIDRTLTVPVENVGKVSGIIKDALSPRVLVPISIMNGLLMRGSSDSKCDFPIERGFIVTGASIMGIHLLCILINHVSKWILTDRTIDKTERCVLKFLQRLTYLSYFIQITLLVVASYMLISFEFATYSGRKIVITDFVEGKQLKQKLCMEFHETLPDAECPFKYCDKFSYEFALILIYTFWGSIGFALVCMAYIYVGRMIYQKQD